MRIYIKAISVFLIVALLTIILPVPTIYAANELKEYSIEVVGTNGYSENVPLFLINNKIMIPIKTVAKITRCELSINGDEYVLKHAKGIRTIKLDANKQTLTENGESYKTYIVEHNGTILVQAYTILTYLGANCRVDNSSSSLMVYMPLRTFWEAYEFTYEKKMNVISYGSNTKNINVACDLMVDFFAKLTPQSAWSNIMGGPDESSAVYEALEADIYKYQSVELGTQERAIKLKESTEILSPLKDMSDSEFDLDLLLSIDDESRSQAYDAIYSFKRRKDQFQDNKYLQNTIKGRESYKKVSESFSDKVGLSLLAVDIFTAVYDSFQIDSTAKDSLSNTFSADTLSSAGNLSLDATYLDAARKTSNTLASPTNTLINAATEKSTDYVMSKCLSLGLEKTVSSFGATALLSIDIGKIVINQLADLPYSKYTPFAQIHSSEADLMAILSSEYYKQTWLVMNGLADKTTEEKFHNAKTMQKLYDSYMLLLRFSLVHYESRIKYCESQFAEPSGKAELVQRAESIAKAIDDLNHCNPIPISKLSDLSSQSTDFDNSLKQLLEKNGFEQLSEASINYWNNKYATILNKYRDYVVKYGKNRTGFNYTAEYPWEDLAGYPDGDLTGKLGYAYRDIDKNGTQELILLCLNDYVSPIYAIYTLNNNKLILLGTYRGRSYCNLDKSGKIYNSGSSSAWDYSAYIYKIADDGQKLDLIEGFGTTRDDRESSGLRYFKFVGSDYSNEKWETISQKEEKELQSKCPNIKSNSGLTFIPIIETNTKQK
jgi:hypothetical protein